MGDAGLYERVRNRVITSLYTGHRRAGDRLPSVRQLGEELGADPRAVLRAYRALEEEGLVEIRPRSGVYLADQRQVAPDLRQEAFEWVASSVLTGAWHRRIPLRELPDLIGRCTGSRRLRCACIDRVEDVRLAFCHELREDFGLDPVPLTLPENEPFPSRASDESLEDVDLVTCTTFHAAEVRKVARRLEKPLVVLSADPVALEHVGGNVDPGELVFVVVDEGFRARLQATFGEETRVYSVDAFDPDTPAGRIVFSRAAAERSGDPEAMRRVPTVPVLSREAVQDLCRWIVRLNLGQGG